MVQGDGGIFSGELICYTTEVQAEFDKFMRGQSPLLLFWLDCWIEFDKYKYKFHGAGGPNNLEEILTIFKNRAES
ncbi:hypothetical protein ACIFOT_32530 [Neobacillus sp. NRS-1170]|uniref:hypothetical protein n=1 Tax=Neobacillus sp. NRS-1170 TaxID=3233898 RepID=UPI003D2A95C5